MALTRTFRNATNDDTSTSSLTSAAFDSTGETGIVVFVGHEGAVTTVTVTDNKGNTYTNETKVNHGNGDLSGVMCHSLGAPTVGTGHTVTVTLGAAKPFKWMLVWTVAGTSPTKDVAAQAVGTATTVDAGSLVTTAATVSFFGDKLYNSRNTTPGTGWTEDFDTGTSAHGFSRTDSSGTLDPSCTTADANDWAACAISVKEGSAAAGQPIVKRRGGTPGSSNAQIFGPSTW